MIISECQVAVPGKKYKTKVSCVSTRRLTTVEWLILSCTKKFSSQTEKQYRVKSVFEQVFKFQNSELLIRPCLKSLNDLKVIKIKAGEDYDYNSLKFTEIKLTELGQVMLNDGLLPGEHREIPLEVFYNPMTGKVSTYDIQSDSKKNVIEFGVESDYDLTFPEQRIVKGLQSGAVASGKFTAAKFRIESISNLSEQNLQITSDIAVDLNSDGTINTIPEIISESVFDKVKSLLECKEISDSLLGSLISLNDIERKNIKGSGSLVKKEIQDLCKNSNTLFIRSDFYEIYKRNTTFFKNKIVVVFGSKSQFVIEEKKDKKDTITLIYIPDEFPIPGVVIVNEKEDSLSICKADLKYKDINICAPIAIEDKRMLPNYRMVRGWIESLIKKKLKDESIYSVLAFLPGVSVSSKLTIDSLKEKWSGCDIDEIIIDVKIINDTCNQLGVIPAGMTNISELWEEKIDYQNPDVALNQLEKITEASLISKKSKTYSDIVNYIIESLPTPQNYSELITLTQKIGVRSYEDSSAILGLEEKLYTTVIIEDILQAIVKRTYTRVPSIYSWDTFFNDFYNSIRYVEALIPGISIFEKYELEELKKMIESSPDIGSLQMYYSELVSKVDFLTKSKIDIYSIFNKFDVDKGDLFKNNIVNIGLLLNQFIEFEYNSLRENYIKDGKKDKQKVYVLDTCALIHTPQLFLYFGDEDYVRIPTKVVDELGKIKDGRSDKYSYETAATARSIAKNINEEYLGLFNANNKIRLLIENADLSLLPEDLDPSVPDNQILSVALKYSDCDTTIISDDNVFALTSIAQNIKSISSEDFIKNNKSNYKSIADWEKKVKKIPVVSIPETIKDNQIEVVDNEPQEVNINDLPVRELMKYAPELTNPVMSLLVANSIKTVGQFRALTLQTADSLKAKGKQSIHKKAIKRAISNIDVIIEKMNQSSNIAQ